jgi:fibronectin-binding autotransporter adhesin
VTMNSRQNKSISISYVRKFLFACLIAAGLAGVYAQTPRERAAAKPVDLGQKAIQRMISGQSFAVHTFGVLPFARPLTTTNDSWNGTAGNWNATTWSLGVMPGSGNNALITNTGGQVQLNVTDTIVNLTIGGGNLLNFQNNTQLTVTGSTITNSNSTGSGGITMSAGGNNTNLIIGANVTLTGGGTVTMGNSVNNRIYGVAGSDVLTNANNLIQGSGNIGVGQMGLNNQGTIDANQTTALTIQTSNGTTNSGTLEATAGANLILNGDTYTNTTGTILSSGTNSVVTLENNTVNGGTLNTASGGVIAAAGTPTLNGVTNKGTYQVPNSQNTTIEGTITNTSTGVIQLNGGGNDTNLILGGTSVTLTGGGTVTMDNSPNNRIYGAVGSDVLTNVNNLIQGSGNIGIGQMGLINQGTIDANQVTALTIQTSSGTTNSGTLEATAGANLILDGDTYTNTTGTILASGTNSVVTFQGNTVNGGTLNTASGGVIAAQGNPTLSGVTNKGTYQLPNAQDTTLVGTINNTGTIQLNAAGNDTELIASGTVTLTGGGAITLSDSSNNYLLGSGDAMINVNNTISGSGNIGNGSMAFTNDAGGIVDATSASGHTLLIQTGAAGTTNLGLMEASSGGTLELNNTVANTNGTANGTIEALNGGTVLLSGATISGGILTTAGTGVVLAEGGSELNGSTNTITNAGNLQIPNNNTLYMTGTVNNTGTLALMGVGNDTELAVDSATAVLQGSGTVTLSDSPNNYILAATTGNQLTIDQNISGPGGDIGNGELVLINNSTINATKSAGTNVLYLQPDVNFTNNGTLEATGGGTLVLYGGTFANSSGTITAGTGSTVNLEDSVDVVGGTLNGAGTFVSFGGAELDGSTHAVTSAGTLEIPNNNNLTIAGTINNTGTLELQAAGNNTFLYVGSPTVTLQGSGTITLSDSPNNYILASTTGNQLTIAQPISGPGGDIGNGSVVLVNQSTIDATKSAGTNSLTIQPDATMTNTGLLEATGGGSLILYGGNFINTSGTITAGSGSNVTLENGVTVTGGILNGTGLFTSLGDPTLSGLTNAGTLQIPNNNSTTLVGTINNTGALQLNGAGNNTFLYPSGAVTLTGGGTLTLADSNNNYIQEAVSNSSLTNVNNIISGSGNIGNGNLIFTNEAAGVVDATSAAGHSLVLDSPAPGITNAGLFEASSGGTLVIESAVANAGGTIEGLAGTGSNAGGNVILDDGAVITGGILNTLGTGANASTMSFYGNATLNGVTNDGTIALPNNNSAELQGTITNNGSIQVNGAGNNTFLYINGNTTLNGNGTLVLSNSPNNYIYGIAGTEILTNNSNTIEGSGHIGNGNLGLINNVGGTVLANQPDELFIVTNSSGVTNNGTFQVNTGSTLDITSGPFNNFNSGTGTLTGGTYNVNGGTFQFDNANIVTNAADIILTGASSQIISNTSANALANFATNAAGGVFQLGAGRSFTTSAPGGGNFTNDGTLIVGGGDTFKVAGALSNFTGTTLSGGTYYVAGTLQFGASGSHIVTNSANLTLAGANPELIDLGGNNLLTQLNDNASGATFTIAAGGSYSTPGNFTNGGTMDTEQASSLTVTGNLANSGTVATNLQNLQGGANTFAVTGTLTNNTGATVSIGENNDTSDVANVGLLANSGTVTVGTGATMNLTSAGTDTNGGAITADGGTLDMQTGSFTNSTGGSLDAEAGGKITVTGNLTNSGALSTNIANLGGAANTLTVTGTLTNNTGATTTIGANGDTHDTASVGLLSNAGTVAVDKGATLKLTATGADSNTGSITATGGTLSIASGNAFTNATAGTLDLESGSKLSVTGNVTNQGALTTNKANLGGAANTITISGKLSNAAGATVTIGANGDTTDTASVGLLGNAGTVAVDKGATLKMTATGADSNSGSLTATGGTVTVASGGAFTNATTGTLDLESGGKLSVTGGLTNAGSLTTNKANLGGAANSLTISGALTNNTGATVIIGDNNDTADTANIGSLANSGAVTVGTGATLALSTAATDTNAGTIAVDGTLDVKLASTLSGRGTLTMTNGAITGLGATGPAFTNASTIQGSGTISNLGITNSGTLTANQSAALVILPTAAGLDNTGTINVAAGDTMQIGTSAGGALTNFSGTTLTGGIYNVTGTLQFGASGTTIATNAATITLSGTGKMIDFGSNNILAGFNDNSSTGIFKMASGATLTTTGGSFTNAGTFVAGTGTTFTVGGSSFNFTETGGSAQVNGTLTSSTLGTLAINAGTVDGTGTLGYNVVDSSVLTPGDSATVTGKLTVTDTYTQQSAGALDIQINGATAGTNYDILKVNETATLGGTLNITLGSFTPTVGETFTILTASSVTDTFSTVNGLAINGSEHFTITYHAGSVVLTVVSGALATSGPASGVLTRLLPAPVHHGSGREGRYGLGILEPKTARVGALVPGLSMARRPVALPVSTGQFAAGMGQLPAMAHGFSMAHMPAAPTAKAPIAWPVSFAIQPTGMRGFKAMDQFGGTSIASAPVSGGDASAAGSFGLSGTSAEAYNSMGAMNHMRFECGLDLKAALKTSRKKLWKGLWAAPDSPDALYLGYMTYTASH